MEINIQNNYFEILIIYFYIKILSFKIIIKFFIILIIILSNISIISNINIAFSYIKARYEIQNIDNYLKLCSDFKFLRKFKKRYNPKISVISPIYNRELLIIRLLRSIQYQKFDDIEIILVDDCSSDNSIEKIKEFKQIDERIILIKNKKNKGTFTSRNLGALYAKGKYIIIPDPDDIISKNILLICYNYAEKYKYELIRFNIYTGNKKHFFSNIIKEIGNKQINQPELSTYIFYNNNELKITDFYIYNKFIRKDVYIKALNYLGNNNLNIYIVLNEDQIMNYILHRTAKSYYFIKTIGYRYINNKLSITKTTFKVIKLKIYFIFIHLNFIYKYSKNVKYEKDIFNFILNKNYYNVKLINNFFSFTKNDYNFYSNLINLYLNCIFITKENKYLLEEFKTILEKNKYKK